MFDLPYTETEIEDILEAEVIEKLKELHLNRTNSVVRKEIEGGGISYSLEVDDNNDYFTQEEKEIVANENLNLIKFIASQYNLSNLYVDIDEIESVAGVAFVKALNSYKKTSKVAFSTFVCVCMKNEIFTFLKKEERRKETFSLDAEIENVKQNSYGSRNKSLSYFDVSNIDDDSFEDELNRQEIFELLNELLDTEFDPKEQFIIKSYYGFDGFTKRTQTEIANMLHISQPGLLKKMRVATDKLKHLLNTRYKIKNFQDLW